MNKDFIYIDNTTALRSLCDQMVNSSWLAVDTEFERERTYYPELCLLQFANTEITAIIDPIAINDMQPVYDLLYNTSITKVFHSARQDLEIFFHLYGRLPLPLYDTQIAATVTGEDNSIGYAHLVEKMLGVTLDKAYTRTDWKRRPLKPSHLRYAADDVIYLGMVYEELLAKLTDSDKLSRLQKELDNLKDPLLYVPMPETMWKKIHEARRLNGDNLAALQALATWRELTARKDNLPRKWVISDPLLIDIARNLPANEPELSTLRGVDEAMLKRYGTELLSIVRSVIA